MKQIVLRYGLLSGAFAAVLMLGSVFYFNANPESENGTLIGYAGILLSMIFVYLGVRSYREQADGALSFGKGFQIGLLIALISSFCYVITWMIVSETLMPDFMDKYIQQSLARLQESGMAEADLEEKKAEMEYYRELYKNPLGRFFMTLAEPFPTGLAVALVSALILRKK